MDFITNAFQNILNAFNDSLPSTIGVIVILIIGIFVAKLLKSIISKLIRKTGIDNKLKNSKLKLSTFIGKIVYFLVLIFAFMLALEKLGMTSILDPVKGLLDGFLKFIPNIVGAGLVGYIGYMLATIISEFVGLSGETIEKFAPKLRLPENINLVTILKKVVFIFIFIPLLISALNILSIDAVSGPAINMLETFFDAIPRILVAAIIMIIFIVAAKFLSGLIKDLLDSLNVNEILKKANLTAIVGKINIEKLISNIVFLFIVLFGLMTAIEKLKFDKLSEIVNTIVNLSGNILFGLIILAIGNWLANVASKHFINTVNNQFVGSIIKVAIIAIFLAIGLEKMGIADNIINLAFGITLGAVALTVVLSFGLGGREAAGKHMEKILNKFNKK